MATYKYIEDNAGGLFLFVFDGNEIIAGIQDLEHAQPGEWIEVKDALSADPIAAISTWEGHMDDPETLWNDMLAYDYGYEPVCENGIVRPDHMGRAAQRYFGIDAE